VGVKFGLLLGVTTGHLPPGNVGRHGTAEPSLFGASTNVQSETGWSRTNCAYGPALSAAAKFIASGIYLYGGLTSNSSSFASSLLRMSGLGLSVKPGTEAQHPGWGGMLIPIPGALSVIYRWPADGAVNPSN
jgi:hypothetical protein